MLYVRRFTPQFTPGFIVFPLLLIVLGISLMLKPAFSALAVCRLFGTLILFLGLYKIGGLFKKDVYQNQFHSRVIQGAIYFFLSAIFLLAPKVVITAVPVFLGVMTLIAAFLMLQLALYLQRLRYQAWLVFLIVALITAAMGTTLLFNPFAGSIFLTRLIGFCLVLVGAVNLYGIYHLKRFFSRRNEPHGWYHKNP